MFGLSLKDFCVRCACAILVLFGAYCLYLLRWEIAAIATSLFFVALIHPVLERLEKKGIPSALSTLIIFLIIIGILGLWVGSAIPLITEWVHSLVNKLQTVDYSGIINSLPISIQNLISPYDSTTITSLLLEQKEAILSAMKKVVSGGSGMVTSIAWGTASVIGVIVFTFFFSLERKQIGKFILTLLPGNWSKKLEESKEEIFLAFLDWIKGQALLSLSIFLATLIGLLGLKLFGIGVPHIFALALVAWIAECIPYAGPIIALIPALSLSLSEGNVTILSVLILYTVIQQLENNILVPYLVGKRLSLSPSYVLVATFLGFALFGVMGVLVALPVAVAIRILAKPQKKHK